MAAMVTGPRRRGVRPVLSDRDRTGPSAALLIGVLWLASARPDPASSTHGVRV